MYNLIQFTDKDSKYTHQTKLYNTLFDIQIHKISIFNTLYSEFNQTYVKYVNNIIRHLCFGYNALTNSIINRSNINNNDNLHRVNYYFSGYLSGYNTIINCNNNDICVINCVSSNACQISAVNCFGTCIIDSLSKHRCRSTKW